MADTKIPDWPRQAASIQDMRRPITEDWLVANGFRIDSGRNDPRFPVRTLAVGSDFHGGRPFLGASDDLCIDIAPVSEKREEWFVWIAQREPYRHIHVRHMRFTYELIRLYEGLTGAVWPGVL